MKVLLILSGAAFAALALFYIILAAALFWIHYPHSKRNNRGDD